MEEPASSRSHGTSYVRNEGRHPLAKACDQCHRCKVACNGGRPACDRCEKNDSTCTYSTGKPVGKPKGSKNRSKPEAQRAHVNKANPAPSRQLSGSEGSGKRRMNVGTSPGAHQLDNHKRQRSIPGLPSPTFQDDSVPEFFEEAEVSPRVSVSSAHASEQFELQAGRTITTCSAPTPELLKLQLSPFHPPEHEVDATFDHNINFTDDWISDLVNDAPHNSSLDTIVPTLEPAKSSLTSPVSLLDGRSHILDEISGSKTPTVGPPDARRGCMCITELLIVTPELEQYSMGRVKISVDGVLRLTRRGFSAISNHLDCPCHTQTNSAQISLLACVLVLMQIGACYVFLRSSLEDPEYQKHLLVSVGGLTIEENETRRQVVHAVLDAEIRQTVGLSTRLEEWGIQLQTDLSGLPCKQLLLSVRQGLDRAFEQQGQE